MLSPNRQFEDGETYPVISSTKFIVHIFWFHETTVNPTKNPKPASQNHGQNHKNRSIGGRYRPNWLVKWLAPFFWCFYGRQLYSQFFLNFIFAQWFKSIDLFDSHILQLTSLTSFFFKFKSSYSFLWVKILNISWFN